MMVRTVPDTCVWNSSLVTPGWLGPNNFADDLQSLESTSQGLAEAPSYILASSHKVGCCTVRPERRGLIAFGSFLLSIEWRIGEVSLKRKRKENKHIAVHSVQSAGSTFVHRYTNLYVKQSIKLLTLYIHTVPTARHCLNMNMPCLYESGPKLFVSPCSCNSMFPPQPPNSPGEWVQCSQPLPIFQLAG